MDVLDFDKKETHMKTAPANIFVATGLALLFAGCATIETTDVRDSQSKYNDIKNFNAADLCVSSKINELQKKTVTQLADGGYEVDVAPYAVDASTLASIVNICEERSGQKSVFFDLSNGAIFTGHTYFTNKPPLP
jgi:hypothetical protein